ncbi:hypothetical protein [Maribacter sp. MJ134]|uniref:hypothetical protein n=1 Tax=Maribacter sp. MJ134 TaxID=2496865 RepID=UPI0013E05918|nr:hypothetical protein [Maribacter sp. MJ134]
MTKVRIIGFTILVLGIVVKFVIQNDATDFVSGIFIGAGIGLLLTGKVRKTTK